MANIDPAHIQIILYFKLKKSKSMNAYYLQQLTEEANPIYVPAVTEDIPTFPLSKPANCHSYLNCNDHHNE